jgi:hypothetical protein
VSSGHPTAPARTHREALIAWARWGVTHHEQFVYTEGGQRWHIVESPPGSLPQWADCSSFVTGIARWAGCGDPNGKNYRYGFTGTLLEHCNHIAAKQALPGDLIVYGPGTGHHVVTIVGNVPGDFDVVSHGHPGTPQLILHTIMAATQPGPVTFLRWLSPDPT